MKKPLDLRQYLLTYVPALTKNPDQLQVFIDRGSLQTRLRTSLHYEYQYTLNLILTDLAIHPDAVLVPLLAWLRINQPDLADDAIQFEADVVRHDLIDLSITIPLTERVLISIDIDGNYQTTHADEPQPEENLPPPDAFLTLHQGDEQLTPGEPA